MALPSGFLEELRIRTPLAGLIGRRVRLARSGKQWKGCCPFHGERTPSFYVYDDGYHCFGCGAHGDAISFVMQSQGLPSWTQLRNWRGKLAGGAESLTRGSRGRTPPPGYHWCAGGGGGVFSAAPGAAGRAGGARLPAGRGLTEATIMRFGLGWAGNRGGLMAELSRQGIDIEQLADAGLIRRTRKPVAPLNCSRSA